jgi:hypothetical protein
MAELCKTRPVSWLKPALREFEKFPEGAQSICLTAFTIAAEGGKADIAKPLHGLGSGVLEIALPTGLSARCSSAAISGWSTPSRRKRRKASGRPNVRLNSSKTV